MTQFTPSFPTPLHTLAEGWLDVDSNSAQHILNDKQVLLSSTYRQGVDILEQLKEVLHIEASASFAERTKANARFRHAAKNLVVCVKNGRPMLDGIDGNPFFDEYYPKPSVYLPFIAVQEICGAWKTHSNGVHYPVLGKRLHPFFGVYYPKRTEHLELFATWLSQYKGTKSHCVDVGTGSGILSFLLAKAGFTHIDATDQNPNALCSVQKDLTHIQTVSTIHLHHADLLTPIETTPLIVFNPPWIPGEARSAVTEALFFDGGLFERFFNQAAEKLSADGRIVFLFSNILTLLRPDLPHPIERELSMGRFTLAQKLTRKIKQKKGRRTKEKVEVWELKRA